MRWGRLVLVCLRYRRACSLCLTVRYLYQLVRGSRGRGHHYG
jgi:hypothetical protein